MILSNEIFLLGINQHKMNAYQHLYQRYYKPLVIYAMGTLNDQEQCEDLVQETIIAIWQKDVEFKSIEQFESYIYNSVHNRVANEIRHLHVKDKYATYVKETESELEMNDSQIIEDLYAQLFSAIDQLPEKQRKVILLAMEGKSNADIAEVLELSIETVKTHRKLAMKRLREITRSVVFLLLITSISQL